MQCECLGLAPLLREVGRSLEEELALGLCWVERWSGKWQRSAWVGQWVGQCLFLKELKGTYSLLLKKMIVLLVVLLDVIPFGLAAGSLWAGLGPGGEILSYHK